MPLRTNDQLRARERTPAPPVSGRGGHRYIEVGGGGPGGKSPANTAKITARAGTEPPWIYSGVQVEFAADEFSEVSGGEDLGNKLHNAAEQGPIAESSGGNPVENDEIVIYFKAGSEFVFERSPYKGTYP